MRAPCVTYSLEWLGTKGEIGVCHKRVDNSCLASNH